MRDLIEKLRQRDKILRDHHQRKTSKPVDAPFTLEGMAADEIERLRAALEYADKQLRGYGQIDPVIRKALADEQTLDRKEG